MVKHSSAPTRRRQHTSTLALITFAALFSLIQSRLTLLSPVNLQSKFLSKRRLLVNSNRRRVDQSKLCQLRIHTLWSLNRKCSQMIHPCRSGVCTTTPATPRPVGTSPRSNSLWTQTVTSLRFSLPKGESARSSRRCATWRRSGWQWESSSTRMRKISTT